MIHYLRKDVHHCPKKLVEHQQMGWQGLLFPHRHPNHRQCGQTCMGIHWLEGSCRYTLKMTDDSYCSVGILGVAEGILLSACLCDLDQSPNKHDRVGWLHEIPMVKTRKKITIGGNVLNISWRAFNQIKLLMLLTMHVQLSFACKMLM